MLSIDPTVHKSVQPARTSRTPWLHRLGHYLNPHPHTHLGFPGHLLRHRLPCRQNIPCVARNSTDTVVAVHPPPSTFVDPIVVLRDRLGDGSTSSRATDSCATWTPPTRLGPSSPPRAHRHRREFIPFLHHSSIQGGEPHRHGQITVGSCSTTVRGSDHPLPRSSPPPLRWSEDVSRNATFAFSGFASAVLVRDAWATMFMTDPTLTSKS
jgi:hypothetical protein